jgi:hypothetical protein
MPSELTNNTTKMPSSVLVECNVGRVENKKQYERGTENIFLK